MEYSLRNAFCKGNVYSYSFRDSVGIFNHQAGYKERKGFSERPKTYLYFAEITWKVIDVQAQEVLNGF